MPLNPARVGHRYPPYRFEVGREHVRSYAVVTGVADARYHDDLGGGADRLTVPPAFVACVAGARAWTRIMGDPELGAHDRLMHGGQEFTFERPVRVGDVLICTPGIADLRSLRGLELLTIEVECADPDGMPVATSRSRLVFMPAERSG